MVYGCGDLSGFTSDKLSSQSRIRHLAFIHLFAREEYRSKYITGANRFTIIHVVARWHHHLYLCHCKKLEVNNINNINAKKGHFIASLNWFVGNFRGKVHIECYIRLFQSYCSTHYGSILWPLHDRGFNDFCVTWNKGVRRMLNISNMTHTAFLGQIINTCHIPIQLVKRFCKFVDLMLTSCNAIVRHFVRRAINSAQSLIGRNIAVIRHRYAICVVDINVKHVHRQYPSSQPELSGTARCILELLCVSNNETYLPGFTKSEVDTMINAHCIC